MSFLLKLYFFKHLNKELDVKELLNPSQIKRYLIILGIFFLIIGLFFLIKKKLGERKHKKDLLLKIKSKGKEKIKKMNSEEEGYELK